MALLCRKCGELANESRREYSNEIVRFIYQHNRYGHPPIEHFVNVLSCDAETIVNEDRTKACVLS
jgi:hypothetical protein